MGKILQRGGDVVQRVACIEQGCIKSLAVERHQCTRGREEFQQGFQHGWFLVRVAHEELCQTEVIPFETSHPDHEGIGSCTACQTAGFGVKEGKRRKRKGGKKGVVRPGGNCVEGTCDGQRLVSVTIIRGVCLFRDKSLAAPGLTESTRNHTLDRETRVGPGPHQL